MLLSLYEAGKRRPGNMGRDQGISTIHQIVSQEMLTQL